MALPNRIRPSFPPNQSLPSGTSISLYAYPTEDRQNESHNHRKLIKPITWTTAFSNSMKLWAMLCRATQDGWVMVESSDKTGSTGEGNGKPLQYSCLENPMNRMKRQRDTEIWTPWVSRCPKCYWRQVETSLQKEWKGGSKSKSNTQLWIWLMMEVKSNALRGILRRNLEC